MGSYENQQPKPGILVSHIKGDISDDDVEKWRADLEKFIEACKANKAGGILMNLSGVQSISLRALDAIMELLAAPDEVIEETRIRFALIGVGAFTKRFMRDAMPLAPIKHIRARFFHETAEAEALAWLQAMIDSADDLPEVEAKSSDGKVDSPGESKKPAGAESRDGRPLLSLLGRNRQNAGTPADPPAGQT
ncbi:MAG: STAS/SEC14 domain-containing protein, partial [Chloroflexi bacterium]|nr:STAS/SEC14 domain-containing protein [Chloroflexota bacterium]